MGIACSIKVAELSQLQFSRAKSYCSLSTGGTLALE